MDLALGAMGSLLPKLGELLNEEYKMQISVKRDVESFSRELASMRAALERVAEVPRDQLDEEVKLWAGDVRELSYDTEDIVDSLLVRVKGSEHGADMDGFKELMSKMANLFKKGKARRQIATAIQDIKEKVQYVAERHKRYKADGVFANLAAATRITAVDPLLVALYEDKQRIVGIHNSRDELIEKLCLTDDTCKQPKILSIVGFGGLGKTTLAKAIYDKVRADFACSAFVSVSRSPDLKKVFKDLLFHVDKQKYMRLSGAALDENLLIDQLRESLGGKRYFIVIDDIWDVNAWKTIRFALMDSKCGSRIITTTRNVGVSKECCSSNDDMVYKMKPLSDGDSQRLFYNRIFPINSICPPELQQVSADILKKCGGVPLAIITLASYLASNQHIKPKSDWYDLLNSIGSGLIKGDANLEEMRRIISFSYYDLPSHLKTCLLYLSIFPEDHYIDRDRLIRRWIAEGFIHGENSFELGQSYFNELVNRSMIEPIFDLGGRATSCLVHDIMLDLICDLSSEENFVTISDVVKRESHLGRKIRRLSLQKSMTELTNNQLATTSMSQVRSFIVFSPAFSQTISFSRFQVLRVLDLEDCDFGQNRDVNLRCVGNLLHLRYLGLRGTGLNEIPMEIGNLLFLQVLDLCGVDVTEYPTSIARLKNLVYLCFDCNSHLPVPIGTMNLTSLEELTGVVFREDGNDNLEALRNLTKLRELSFDWPSSYPREELVILVESLSKLHKLESLEIAENQTESMDVMQGWMPSSNLHTIDFGGSFRTLPTWIRSSSLPLLSKLMIHVHQVRLEDIQILGTFPALRHLELGSDINTAVTEEQARGKQTFMLSADAFPCLRTCYLWEVLLVPSIFALGAMPMVDTLQFSLLVSDILDHGDLDLSIRNLPMLNHVTINIYGAEDSHERSQAKAALEQASADHPNNPNIYID